MFGHQCLSAESLVRTHWKAVKPRLKNTVTNAFRLRVWLGRSYRGVALRRFWSHQCLSAESLVRTDPITFKVAFSAVWSPMPFG